MPKVKEDKKSPAAPWTVKAHRDIATFFDVSVPTIQLWSKEGMPGAAPAYDLSEIYKWRRARERERVKTSAKNTPEHRKIEWQARRERLKYLQESAQLINREDHEQLVLTILHKFRQKLESLALSLGTQGVGLNQKSSVILHKERFDELLLELSEHAGDVVPKKKTAKRA